MYVALYLHSLCSVICQKAEDKGFKLDLGDLESVEESMVLTVSEPTYFTGIAVVKQRRAECPTALCL